MKMLFLCPLHSLLPSSMHTSKHIACTLYKWAEDIASSFDEKDFLSFLPYVCVMPPVCTT